MWYFLPWFQFLFYIRNPDYVSCGEHFTSLTLLYSHIMMNSMQGQTQKIKLLGGSWVFKACFRCSFWQNNNNQNLIEFYNIFITHSEPKSVSYSSRIFNTNLDPETTIVAIILMFSISCMITSILTFNC